MFWTQVKVCLGANIVYFEHYCTIYAKWWSPGLQASPLGSFILSCSRLWFLEENHTRRSSKRVSRWTVDNITHLCIYAYTLQCNLAIEYTKMLHNITHYTSSCDIHTCTFIPYISVDQLYYTLSKYTMKRKSITCTHMFCKSLFCCFYYTNIKNEVFLWYEYRYNTYRRLALIKSLTTHTYIKWLLI